MVAAQVWGAAICHAESPKMIGIWTVNITFANGDNRSVRFEARDTGKGSFLLADTGPGGWGTGKASDAKWSLGGDSSVTFSGPMEFPIGNVGRDAGILEFKGKFETEGSIRGDVTFSPIAGEGPSKHGTFKAIRASGG